MPSDDVIHVRPVWRSQATTLIGAAIDDADRSEQLWAQRVATRRFRICCIPFFVYHMSLGDIVVTNDDYEVLSVAERSGRSVYRVFLPDGAMPGEALQEHMAELGALSEWSSRTLLALDASDAVVADRVVSQLKTYERAGHLQWEWGDATEPRDV